MDRWAHRILVVEARGRKTANERTKGKSAKVQEHVVRCSSLVEEKACWRPARKAHLYVEGDGVYLGVKGTAGEFAVGDKRGI